MEPQPVPVLLLFQIFETFFSQLALQQVHSITKLMPRLVEELQQLQLINLLKHQIKQLSWYLMLIQLEGYLSHWVEVQVYVLTLRQLKSLVAKMLYSIALTQYHLRTRYLFNVKELLFAKILSQRQIRSLLELYLFTHR